LKPAARLDLYEALLSITQNTVQHSSERNPELAQQAIQDWYRQTAQAVTAHPHELDLKRLFIGGLLDFALDDHVLIAEALEISSQLAHVFDLHRPYFPLVFERVELLARERSLAQARECLITSLSEPRIFSEIGLSAFSEYEHAVRLLIDWHLTDRTSLAFVENVANLLPSELTSFLLAKFYAARDDYALALTVMDQLVADHAAFEPDDIFGRLHFEEYVDYRDCYQRLADRSRAQSCSAQTKGQEGSSPSF
jgi:hypothetical protein